MIEGYGCNLLENNHVLFQGYVNVRQWITQHFTYRLNSVILKDITEGQNIGGNVEYCKNKNDNKLKQPSSIKLVFPLLRKKNLSND